MGMARSSLNVAVQILHERHFEMAEDTRAGQAESRGDFGDFRKFSKKSPPKAAWWVVIVNLEKMGRLRLFHISPDLLNLLRLKRHGGAGRGRLRDQPAANFVTQGVDPYRAQGADLHACWPCPDATG
jgi:hypothetical protein